MKMHRWLDMNKKKASVASLAVDMQMRGSAPMPVERKPQRSHSRSVFSMSYRAAIGRWLAALLFTALAACSESPGGGGIGGTGKAIAPDGLIVGVVDGFGSIVLNEQRFETDSATIFVDGNEAQLDDLSVGMNIVARVDSPQNEALQLRYQPDVAGSVTAVADDLSSLQILGQTVYLNAEPVYDELDQSEIVPGIALEVSGNRNADHAIVATYIRRASGVQQAFTVGRVDGNTDDEGPMIGRAVIDATVLASELGITVEEYESAYLEHGTLVRLEAMVSDEPVITSTAADMQRTVLTATGVAAVTRPPYNAGDVVELLGVVGEAISQDTYLVANVVVTIDDDTEVVTRFNVPMDLPDSPENRMVLLNGVALSVNGAVLVTRIQFLDEN